MALFRSLVHVAVTALLIAVPVLAGYFDTVKVEVGLDHYAEKPWPFVRELIPWLPMPANTLVNAGYMLVGLWWIFVTSQCRRDKRKRIPEVDAYMSYAFAWMAILYSAAQTWRLVSQRRDSAILDQWYTLPIFSWVPVWAAHIMYGWNPVRMLLVTVVSCGSYSLALLSNVGFEVALGLHILAAVLPALKLYAEYNSPEVKSAFYKALISCAGFVVLKILDHPLANVSDIFTYISGHFLSKIADFLQIYYTAQFFFLITLLKHAKRKY